MKSLIHRPRRLRSSDRLRRMVRENHVTKEDLLYPMFVTEERESREIPSMPGVFRYTIDDLCRATEEVAAAGIPAIMLFGIPAEKDEVGSQGYSEEGIVARALRAVRKTVGDALLLVPDVCLCEYTSHGHCGVIENGDVANDPTVELLAKAAVCYVRAGADVIAPSDMMDGRVGAIRAALDSEGFAGTPAGFMGLFVRQRTARRNLVTAAPIRWTRPTGAKRCAR